MRFLISFLVVAVLAVSGLTACSSNEKTAGPSAGKTAPGGAPANADGVRRVTVAQLKDLLAKNEAVVIDVRTEPSYNIGHIRGSKLIPESEVVNHIDELPKNKLIVAYCSCSHEQEAIRAVTDLKAKGMENAAALLGGFAAWQGAGLPVDSKTATP
jgi:rhodanese-related sulfurtransferase